ncbi:hypothetical protein [Helicobacter sp. 23-1045]
MFVSLTRLAMTNLAQILQNRRISCVKKGRFCARFCNFTHFSQNLPSHFSQNLIFCYNAPLFFYKGHFCSAQNSHN